MKIIAKTDYACRAILELSLHWPKNDPVQIKAIANNQQIPIKFLIHILIQLKQLGYVKSIRGQKGGYVLIKPPKNIFLKDILKSFSDIHLTPQVTTAKMKKNDVIQTIWQEADQVMLNYLGNINFDDICKKDRSLTSVPMYTI